jgi:NADH:ubiquinone oxidoreductase subunit 5 (subunit L)/multisubunit Na+/H+ antiporter MnhA subunit
MEGPTPVSALLHAATMVAAGVFLLVRCNQLFVQAPLTLQLMLWVGAFTALFAALVATVQTDIKRVLAYSTCSQLGYMVAGIGAGAAFPAYFHLATHAFFKALLFLAAGSVIHAVHSNELKDMGGLAKRMPVTALCFGIGALALVGFPGFSGFFSKDSILESVAESHAWLPLTLLMLSAGLTAFYMTRTYVLAFLGRSRGHGHESPLTMTAPLVLLSIGALAAGWFGKPLAHAVLQNYHFEFGAVSGFATMLGLGGLAAAGFAYARGPADEPAPVRALASIANAAMVDKTFAALFRGAALPVARGVGWLDRYVVDGFINVTGWLGLVASRSLQRLQTGNTLDYLAAVAAGALLILASGVIR